MPEVNFDDYAHEYNQLLQKQLNFFDKDTQYFAEYKVALIKEYCGRFSSGRVLEYGCGVGRNLPFFSQIFPQAELFGCDVSAAGLEQARQSNPGVKFFLVDGASQDLPGAFDLIFVAGVFHHIDEEKRLPVMQRLSQWLNVTGKIFIFEHNPFNPLTRYLVKTCPFDKGVKLLGPSSLGKLCKSSGLEVKVQRYTLFFPGSLKFLRPGERHLGWLPLGGQYFVCAQKRRQM